MDDEPLNFGADAAGGTPDADSILAQPPLQEESPGKEENPGEAAECKHSGPPNSPNFRKVLDPDTLQLLTSQ